MLPGSSIYNLKVLNWNISEIKKIDSKIRKLLICNKMHHLRADADRLYLFPEAEEVEVGSNFISGIKSPQHNWTG